MNMNVEILAQGTTSAQISSLKTPHNPSNPDDPYYYGNLAAHEEFALFQRSENYKKMAFGGGALSLILLGTLAFTFMRRKKQASTSHTPSQKQIDAAVAEAVAKAKTAAAQELAGANEQIAAANARAEAAEAQHQEVLATQAKLQAEHRAELSATQARLSEIEDALSDAEAEVARLTQLAAPAQDMNDHDLFDDEHPQPSAAVAPQRSEREALLERGLRQAGKEVETLRAKISYFEGELNAEVDAAESDATKIDALQEQVSALEEQLVAAQEAAMPDFGDDVALPPMFNPEDWDIADREPIKPLVDFSIPNKMTVDLIEQKPEPVEPLAKTAVELNVPEPAHATQYEWDEKRLNRLRLEATGVLKTIEAAQNWDETDLPVEEEELDLVALAKARGVVANLESQTTDEEVAAHKARLAWRRRKEEAVGQERVELVSRDGRFYVFGREIKLDENQSFMGAMVKNGEVYVQFKQTDQVEIKRGAFRKSHYEERTRVLLVPVEELYIDSELEAELPTDDNVVAFPLSA